jgi:hypothetical protein
MTWYAGSNSTNNGSLGWVFEAPGGGGVTVNVTGVSATGSVGNVSVVINVNAYIYSFETPWIRTAIFQALLNDEPGKTLFKDTTIGGRPLADIDDNGSITIADFVAYTRWEDKSPLLNPAHETYIETVMNAYMTQNPVPYKEYISFAYTETGSVSIKISANVSLTGISASGLIGDVVVSIATNVPVSGISASGQLGSVTVIANSFVEIIGVSATGFIGSVEITADSVVFADGVYATGLIGSPNILIVVPVNGVQGATALGTITIKTNNYINVTGFDMVGLIGLADVFGVWSIPDDVQNNWIEDLPDANVWIDKISQSNTWTLQ